MGEKQLKKEKKFKIVSEEKKKSDTKIWNTGMLKYSFHGNIEILNQQQVIHANSFQIYLFKRRKSRRSMLHVFVSFMPGGSPMAMDCMNRKNRP